MASSKAAGGFRAENQTRRRPRRSYGTVESVETVLIATLPQPAQSGKLLKILGVGFGVAVGIGGTIGVGILRNPGGVAEQLGSVWPIMLTWLLGGIYCLLGVQTISPSLR